MDIKSLIEDLRTTLLWETVYGFIENAAQATTLLKRANLGPDLLVEKASIQDSEDFFITGIVENDNKYSISFEMPFILCVNQKYNIEAMAVGKLEIPNISSFSYEKYDFSSMSKKQLLSMGDIVCISQIKYEDVEIVGTW